MKKIVSTFALIAALSIPALCVAQAPAGAPTGSTAQCNDGTYFSGATKSGACRGHQGVKTWWGAAGSTTTPAATTTKTKEKANQTKSTETTTPKTAEKTKTTTAVASTGQAPVDLSLLQPIH